MANLPKFLKTRKWLRSLIQEDGDVEYCEDGEFWPACEEVKVTIDVEITETIKHVRQYEAYMPISKLTGETIYAFAYPFGNYDKRIISLVKEAGYKFAFGTDVINNQGDDPFEIPRIGIYSHQKAYLSAKLSGLYLKPIKLSTFS